MNYQIFHGNDCILGDIHSLDKACAVVGEIINANNGIVLGAGEDGDNFWWLVKFDNNYESFSVKWY